MRVIQYSVPLGGVVSLTVSTINHAAPLKARDRWPTEVRSIQVDAMNVAGTVVDLDCAAAGTPATDLSCHLSLSAGQDVR
jgi:hypothetical protein